MQIYDAMNVNNAFIVFFVQDCTCEKCLAVLRLLACEAALVGLPCYASERIGLHEVADDFFLVAWQHVNHWNLNHGVASRLLAHSGACHVDEHL